VPRLFVPEVIQTSGMDCGPASLKALLEGFGIPVSYGRLREACQTGVDGTSIDTMETTAVALGLDAEQILIPIDHLLLAESNCLPAIVVVQLSNYGTHFVVVWRRHGSWLQVMDPAVGRRWTTVRDFLRTVHLHTQQVPVEAWRDWAAADQFTHGLKARLTLLGVRGTDATALIGEAFSAPGWRKVAALDAAVRMTAALVENGALKRGTSSAAWIRNLAAEPDSIPVSYWSVFANPDDEETIGMRGVVLVHASRVSAIRDPSALPEELRAALSEPPPRPLAEIWHTVREDGVLAPAAIASAILLSTVGVAFEALLYRGLLDLARNLSVAGQRYVAIAAILAFLGLMLALEWPIEAAVLRLGRRLENRFRLRFLAKLPRHADRYFQSRLVSDMAQRAHSVHSLRQLPALGAQLLRTVFTLCATLGGIAWLYPSSFPLAAACALAAIAVPLIFQPRLVERDLRQREHTGALTRFYLDALLGLGVIRAHGGQRAMRREQERLLSQWAEAGVRLQRAAVQTEALQLSLATLLVIVFVWQRLTSSGDVAGLLLLAYWALNIPSLGQDLATALWQYPALRNTTLRLVEPLGAPEQQRTAVEASTGAGKAGVAVDIENVTVVAGGHTILDGVSLSIAPGEHIGIVGLSGAGKSSLAGLLLGWNKPARGFVRIDGEPLDSERTDRLRLETAWVDPQVQLWNRPLIQNLLFGNEGRHEDFEPVLDAASLRDVLERLPDGFETVLGEGGGLVSGGQGQRIRAGRAMLRSGVRLAILDEPGRSLDRAHRHRLLEAARRRWKDSTLLAITHDVAETKSFERVLVIEDGKILEDGSPTVLFANPESRYRALCDAESQVREQMWQGPRWRRLHMDSGSLTETKVDG
jgi:ABC-type bacteriocin/lantibiotic exporter with double-glycine peptidase domain